MPVTQQQQGTSENQASEQMNQRSPEELQQLIHNTEAQIDTYLKTMGIRDPSRLVDDDGWRCFQMGSAQGYAFVEESDGEVYLNATAVVMPLPSDKELIVPLMRELLEINTLLTGSTRLGIDNELVLATAIRRIDQLQDEDVGRCIHSVVTFADHLDDKLIEKYGGTSKQRVDAEQMVTEQTSVDTEDKTIVLCPSCSQKLRVPANSSHLHLTCPKCRYEWDG